MKACVGIRGDFLYVYDRCKCMCRARTGIKGRKRHGVRRFASPKVRTLERTCMKTKRTTSVVLHDPNECKKEKA